MHCIENKVEFLSKFLKVEDKDMKLIAADVCLCVAEILVLLSWNCSSTEKLELDWITFLSTHCYHSYLCTVSSNYYSLTRDKKRSAWSLPS